jgi:AcrR family transcriptional regulator
LSEVARHIARAAARLFATGGYDATPVRTIVEAAGVTKPTLYYHFGSKEGLAHALVTVPLGGLVETIRTIVEAPGDPVRKLERTLEAHFQFCREDPDRARFVYAVFFGPLGSGVAAELARFGNDLNAQTSSAVASLVESGHLAADRADDFAVACRGLIVISTMDFLYQGRELGPDLARRLVGDLLHGFGTTVAAATGLGD